MVRATTKGLRLPRMVRRKWGVVLLTVALAVGVVAALLARAPTEVPRRAAVATPTPTFVPKLGDVDDAGDGLSVSTGAVPAYVFKNGGYILSGVVVDAQTGRGISGASVWVTLPPAPGQRTAPALRVVSAASGGFSFSHLAGGAYNIAAARYAALPGQPVYPEAVVMSVMLPQRALVRLALVAALAPGTRRPPAGAARNLIMLDLSGIYAESWFDDPALVMDAQNMRQLAASGARAANVMAPYGWHPTDQYALLSGTYPAWRSFDPWPHVVPWGTPDGMDTTFWYNSPPGSLAFGQESLFDVAGSYGMSTAALGGPHYPLSDVSTRGVQTVQVGLIFDSAGWLASAEHLITTIATNPNGFVFYGELDPPFGAAAAAGATPDAPGGAYAQAMRADDELVGLLRDWLASQRLLTTTDIMVTAAEAQVNETASDNYYGMEPDGLGSSLHVPLVLSGPGVAAGKVEAQVVLSFVVAATAMRALCLPVPANARVPALVSLFSTSCP